MKAPIPEKIKIPIYAQKDIGGWILEKNINSLIDVLIEQQNRLDEIDLKVLSLDEGQEAHGEWHENNRVEDLIPIVNKMQGQKPYTAMRSTGKTATEVVEAIKRHNEPEYCECENPVECKTTRCINVIYDHCAKCEKQFKPQEYCECDKPMTCSALINGSKCGICHDCNKPIKPQEDKMSQIIRILFFSKGWDGTKVEAYDIADKILAIVKGE